MGLLGRVYVYKVTGMIYYKKSANGDDYFTRRKNISLNVMQSIYILCIFQHFLNSGIAEVDVTQTILAESLHAKLDGFLFDDYRGGTLDDKIANRIGDVEKLVETLTAFVARLSTSVATTTGVEALVSNFMRGNSELGENRFVWFVR